MRASSEGEDGGQQLPEVEVLDPPAARAATPPSQAIWALPSRNTPTRAAPAPPAHLQGHGDSLTPPPPTSSQLCRYRAPPLPEVQRESAHRLPLAVGMGGRDWAVSGTALPERAPGPWLRPRAVSRQRRGN